MNDEHACDRKWLCISCFKKAFNIDDNFEWKKVGIMNFRCHMCGTAPIIFLEDDDMHSLNEGSSNDR
jgi:hypothetical protein